MTDEPLPLSPVHKKDIVDTARAILSREMGIIEGCRKLVQLSWYMDERDEEPWLSIRGVESETEDVPVGEQRSLWNKDALAKLEARNDVYLKKIEDGIFEDCRDLIRRYSDTTGE